MKKGLSLLLVLVMLCGLTACAGTDKPLDDTTTVPSATTTTVSKNFNPLTGENDMTGDSTRPVAVMITNEPGIIGKQYGIDKADFYMETEAEGGVARMMAVFASADRIPDKLGPIRSGRTPFIATANALGAVYVYSGATTYVLNVIKTTPNFDSITNTDGVTLWRDSYLSANANVSWNNLITGGDKLVAGMEKRNISDKAIKNIPFSFGDKTGDITAKTIQLKSTASTNVTFIYDAKTGLYGKNNGKATSCKPQKSLEGNQIKVSNVLILHAEKYAEHKDNKYTWYNFKGEGTGYLISNGTARQIKFTRSAHSLNVMEMDGSKALFSTGKTYMFLTDKTLSDSLVFE